MTTAAGKNRAPSKSSTDSQPLFSSKVSGVKLMDASELLSLDMDRSVNEDLNLKVVLISIGTCIRCNGC